MVGSILDPESIQEVCGHTDAVILEQFPATLQHGEGSVYVDAVQTSWHSAPWQSASMCEQIPANKLGEPCIKCGTQSGVSSYNLVSATEHISRVGLVHAYAGFPQCKIVTRKEPG